MDSPKAGGTNGADDGAITGPLHRPANVLPKRHDGAAPCSFSAEASDFRRESGGGSGYCFAVHLAHLRLRDFRNYARLDTDFGPGFHLLLGRNAQGKTNLLEAIYLLATLRSFRGVGGAPMVRHHQAGYFVGARVVAEGTYRITMFWSPRTRRITLNDEPVRRLSDYFGLLRVVVFCSEDLQLVKGPPSRRRRFLNLLLAQTHPSYLPLLQRYARAVRSRNALLKQQPRDETALESFSRTVVELGTEIIRLRRELLPRLASRVQQAYQRVAPDAETLQLEYVSTVREDFAAELRQARPRELKYRGTLLGPHRDDLRLLLDRQPVAQFASEGQKRTLAVALKVAQAEYLTHLYGVPPILLIDDVMGELDASRRAGLLPLLERSGQSRGQVFMTCTEENWPRELGRRLHRWEINQGTLKALSPTR